MSTFDLTTAKPVKAAATRGGFDLSSARAPSGRRVALPPEEKRKHQRAAESAENERFLLEARAENEQSLGGRIHGVLSEVAEDFDPVGYVKDYLGGIAEAGAEANQHNIGPMDAALGVGAPAISYPIAAAGGLVSLPFTGDYRGTRDKIFQTMNDTLPEDAKVAQRAVGSVLKPVGDVFATAGRGIGEIAATPFDEGPGGMAEGVRENVGGIAEDVLGAIPVARAAPKGTPGINPGPRPRQPVTPGPTADPLARARDAGYSIPGSARTAEGKTASHTGSFAEGAAGRTQQQHAHNQKNDLRVLEGIRRDLNLPAKTPITQPAINAVLEETGTAYKAVSEALPVLTKTEKLDAAIANIGERRRSNPLLEEAPRVSRLRRRGGAAGDMRTEDVMTAVQEFRDTARKIREGAAKAEKPEVQMQMAAAYREMADLLETGLDDALTQMGRGDLIPALKNARMRRAKAYQAQEAVSGKKRPGDALMDMKLAGETLSGEMDLAADVHRDMSANGPLAVNRAKGAAETPGVIQETLTGVMRPVLQPLLTSEMGQRFMFGPRQPDSLSPYSPQQFEVPPPVAMPLEQTDAFGGPLEFEPPSGRSGGQMPSDKRRLAGTISEQIESQGPNADLAAQPGAPGAMPSDVRRLNSTVSRQEALIGPNADLFPPEGNVGGPRLGPPDPQAGILPTDPNAGPPLSSFEELALELEPARFDFEQVVPTERRSGAPGPYTGIERRLPNGAPDLTAERQRVLDRPIGTPPNRGVADQLLARPGMQEAVRGDTIAGRIENNPAEGLPQGAGFDRGPPTAGPIVPETGEFIRTGGGEPPISGPAQFRANANIDPLDNRFQSAAMTPAELDLARQQLAELGYTPEEIEVLLSLGR